MDRFQEIASFIDSSAKDDAKFIDGENMDQAIRNELKQYKKIDEFIQTIQAHTEQVSSLKEKEKFSARSASNQTNPNVDKVEQLSQQTTTVAISTQTCLKALVPQIKNEKSPFLKQVKINLHWRRSQSLRSSFESFEKELQNFNAVIDSRSRGQLTSLGLNPQQVNNVISKGQTEQFVQKYWNAQIQADESTSVQLEELIANLEDRHLRILNLEKSVGEIRQLFLDMEFLVERQGELLNDIDSHISSAMDSTERAHSFLLEAHKYL